MTKQQVFWMVWVEGKAQPTMKHDNPVDAIREAGRLAQKTNTKAYVVETIGVAEPRVEVDFQEMKKCD
jgi:hypothetical protein